MRPLTGEHSRKRFRFFLLDLRFCFSLLERFHRSISLFPLAKRSLRRGDDRHGFRRRRNALKLRGKFLAPLITSSASNHRKTIGRSRRETRRSTNSITHLACRIEAVREREILSRWEEGNYSRAYAPRCIL
ncbi:hypothetical protein SCHPADRAFT_435260 [Schizopora paradoxa]|uniref:Uncharacterized protein n=1 Tax=Schizopora paradoxa TaxID=27342 RepID=A0A0H2RJD8_9AGAM|nr:hypothetical protein SCHPADRAFT_435260 [Schizopora paradoxa]